MWFSFSYCTDKQNFSANWICSSAVAFFGSCFTSPGSLQLLRTSLELFVWNFLQGQFIIGPRKSVLLLYGMFGLIQNFPHSSLCFPRSFIQEVAVFFEPGTMLDQQKKKTAQRPHSHGSLSPALLSPALHCYLSPDNEWSKRLRTMDKVPWQRGFGLVDSRARGKGCGRPSRRPAFGGCLIILWAPLWPPHLYFWLALD